jgi:glyoxylase-like metal-dependent hydrolase (beta-lactamase superfamily II)
LFIPGNNGGIYPYCHSLFIEADLRVILDPASDRKRLEALLEGPGVDAAWLSHYHEDHFRHLDLFEDCEVWISEHDAPALEDLDCFMDFYGMTSAEERDFWRQVIQEQFHFKPRRAARLFREEEVIDLGGVTVEVIPTPGHTAGHCSFFFREPGVLFLGDYDLTPFGPWYGDAVSDIEATIASVKRLRTVPARVWIAAHEHGVFESDPGELWGKFLGLIDEREAKLLDFLAVPRNMDQIVEARILYGKKREPKEFYDFGERAHMGKHLERLMRRGVVVLEEDTYCLA